MYERPYRATVAGDGVAAATAVEGAAVAREEASDSRRDPERTANCDNGSDNGSDSGSGSQLAVAPMVLSMVD